MERILQEWKLFLEAQPTLGQVRPFIVSSWERSRAAGVTATPYAVEFRQVPEPELRRRLHAARDLIALCRPHLEWLSATMGSVAHAAYLTDADGIVLFSVGDPEEARALGLAPGFDWSESAMGTNGAGTALATRQPAAVVGPEHYSSPFHGYICTGAPILAPDGTLLGAIDVSTSVADGSPSRLSLVAHIAFTIETVLAQRQAEAERQRATRFLATLAHELRNPLAPIAHGLEALPLLDHEPEQRHNLYGRMQAQMDRVTRLVEDLMDVSRVACGKVELRKAALDLRAAVAPAIDSVRPICAERGIRLLEDITSEPLPMQGDSARLTQVAANLLSNACKFTPAGGEVKLSLHRAGDEALLRVRDTGLGIRPEDLDKVFDAFVQLEDHPEAAGGLGLGLALVADLVRLHGGAVSADSEGRGTGTEFTISLPLDGRRRPQARQGHGTA